MQKSTEDNLRWHHIQTKATHNSYRPGPVGGGAVAAWRYWHENLTTQLETQGVRALELDVHWSSTTGDYPVYHVHPLPPLVSDNRSHDDCTSIRSCLQVIRAWSEERPAHQPLFLFVEPKTMPAEEDDWDTFFDGIDIAIRDRLAGQIVLPRDVLGEYKSGGAVAAAGAWPTIEATRGKVVAVLLARGSWRDAYAARSVDQRSMLMLGKGDRETLKEMQGFGIVSYERPQDHQDDIRALIAQGRLIRAHVDYQVQERYDNNPCVLEAAKAMGVHFLTTDFPWPTRRPLPNGFDCDPGAWVGGETPCQKEPAFLQERTDLESICRYHWVSIPGALASRCNPVTAADIACQDASIENPMHVYNFERHFNPCVEMGFEGPQCSESLLR
ncbi:MAG: Ca2+-dependent phosphoinositide-specific phospholipase C [Polyangiales bacterium]